MPTGSCFCEKVKYEYSGDPAMKATCHCLACRKISGSSNTLNLLVPKDRFQVTSGTPKEFSKTHESGMELTIFFCDNCGSVISKEGDADAFRGVVIVQAGTLDDVEGLDMGKPGAELYVKHRASWLPEVAGAGQMQEFS